MNNYKLHNVSIYAALSILQHHGCKTPLLDWTRNPNVAFYFATKSDESLFKKIIFGKILKTLGFLFGKRKNIKDYFSIYFITKEHPYYKFTSKSGYEEVINSDVENILIKSRVDEVIEHGGDQYLQQEAKENAINELIQNGVNQNQSTTNNIINFPIHRIEDNPNEKITHFLNINNNINAQNGLFIINADPYKPLEEAIIKRTIDLASQKGLPKIHINEALARNKENFICYDIHKKFIPKIIDTLNSEKVTITKDTMFPDFAKLKNEITFDKIINKMNQVNV